MIEAILRALYDSEINCSICSTWDSGYTVRLGDGGYNNSDDWVDEEYHLNTLNDVAEWLRYAACRHYPNSNFAKLCWGLEPKSPIRKSEAL